MERDVRLQLWMPVVALISPRRREERRTSGHAPSPIVCDLGFCDRFNMEHDVKETFLNELSSLRLGDLFVPRPQPLIVQTYLDTSELTNNRALIVLDGNEKRWNVMVAFRDAARRAGFNVGPKRGGRDTAPP